MSPFVTSASQNMVDPAQSELAETCRPECAPADNTASAPKDRGLQINGDLETGQGSEADDAGSLESSTEDAEEEVKNANHRRLLFIFWLLTLVVFWLSAGVGIVILQKRLLETDRQNTPRGYLFTIILSYLYVRGLMHVVTKKLLSQQSRLYQAMPPSLQEDCAFLLVDSTMICFGGPILLYLVAYLFRSGEIALFYQDCRTLTYWGLGLYQIDRFFQLMSYFTTQRLIHHVAACLFVLTFLEWKNLAANPGVLLVGGPIEILGKPFFGWVVVTRFTRRHVRATHSFAVPAHGIDALFIPRSAERMSKWGRLFLGMEWTSSVILPVGLLTGYVCVIEGVTRAWAIGNFVVLLFFWLIDLDIFRLNWKYSHASYWQGLCREEEEEEGTEK